MSRLLFPIAVLSLVFLASCKPKPVFEETKAVNASGWAYTDTLAFQFEIADTSSRYTMQLDIAWAKDFKHQNLYLKLGTLFPDAKYQQVVRSYDLYDQEGKPFGTSKSGGYTGTFLLQEATMFSAPGTYRFTVAQHTRDEMLLGVKSLGLRVVKEKSSGE